MQPFYRGYADGWVERQRRVKEHERREYQQGYREGTRDLKRSRSAYRSKVKANA